MSSTFSVLQSTDEQALQLRVQDLWSQCLSDTREQGLYSQTDIDTYGAPAQMYYRSGTLFAVLPNEYLKQDFERIFLPELEAACQRQEDIAVNSVHVVVGSLPAVQTVIREQHSPIRFSTRGRTSESIREQIQEELYELERHRNFSVHPMLSKNEYPTLFTRFPIFVPGRASKQRAYLDRDNALRFETPWGEGRKYGPPLSIYDEDTLIALFSLRNTEVIGPPSDLPYPLPKGLITPGQDNVSVHLVYCMVSDIQGACGTSQGGRNNKIRLDSVRRLANTKIEFIETRDKSNISGTSIDLLHVAWGYFEDNAVLVIQFPPVVANLLKDAYTYVDLSLRKKLKTDVAKCLHRFLAGQPHKYSIFTKKLAHTIGYHGEYKKFMRDLRQGLKELERENWLSEWLIEGNGRGDPHKVTIVRRKRSA